MCARHTVRAAVPTVDPAPAADADASGGGPARRLALSASTGAAVPEPLYVGHRVALRRLMPSDLPSLYAGPSLRQAHLAYRPWQRCEPADLPSMMERLKLVQALEPTIEIELLVLHRPTGVPMGMVCLSAIDLLNRKAELSVAFFRGQGTRAALEATHWALETFFSRSHGHDMRKLTFVVMPENRAAVRYLQHLSVGLEARLIAEIVLPDGRVSDLLRYALLRDDWSSGPTRGLLRRLAPLRDVA